VKRTIQLTIDCAEPDRLARFWALALDYVPEEPPGGFPSWVEYWRSRGVSENELGGEGYDSIVDPSGVGPRIWFQPVPEPKLVKNRVHLDLMVSGGGGVPLAARQSRVNAEVARLEAAGATRVGVVPTTAREHYGVAMLDPEGNEFDVG